MFRNYLKSTIRNLLKHKVYSAINIGGLSIGLACCFIIFIYVRFELSFDQYHQHADRIYRLLKGSTVDSENLVAVTPAGYATFMPDDFPEVDQIVRVFDMPATLKKNTEMFTLNRFAYVDPSIFEIFDYTLLEGDPQTALDAPGSLVLSKDAAESIFGESDPYGQSVDLILENNSYPFLVTGIMENMPRNSHMRFDYFVPFETIKSFQGEDALENFTNSNYYTYIMLNKGVTPQSLEMKFPEFLRKTRGEAAATQNRLLLQPLLDIHLNTGITFDRATTTSRQNLTIFSSIAVLILMIACINFMNLSTARSTLRATEVGVRKVVGATRKKLIFQFLFESMVSGIAAFIFSSFLIHLFIPEVGTLLGRDIPFALLSNPQRILLLFFIGLAAGLLAGIYPALVLSLFKPVTVIKGTPLRGLKGRSFRSVLIVIQFSITIFMLISMGTVYNQLSYAKHRDLGFNKEAVLRIQITQNIKDRYGVLRERLLQNPGILNVTMVRGFPGYVNMKRGHRWPGQENDAEEKNLSIHTMLVDYHTIETLEFNIIKGRNFSREISTDEGHGYILNETAVREMGFQDPIGQPFRAWSEEMGRIIGVVEDFHFKSLHQEIEPLVLDIHPEWCWTVLIRISSDGIREILPIIEREWIQLEPERPYSYRFLDDLFDRLYRTEQRLGSLFSIFTALALLVACLGIFGMVTFIADRRKKEIGIRKVLGASVPEIMKLISRDFSKLVLLATIVSTPFAAIMMNRWLQNFAYRTQVNVGQILIVGILAQLITLATISVQTLRASLANPVHSLKTE